METDIEMLQNLGNSRELNKSMEASDSSNDESNDCDGVFLRSIRQEVSESYEEETNLSEIFYLQSDFTLEPKIIKTEVEDDDSVQKSSKPKVSIKTEPNQTDTNLKKFYEEFNENEFVEFYEQDQKMAATTEFSQSKESSHQLEDAPQQNNTSKNSMTENITAAVKKSTAAQENNSVTPVKKEINTTGAACVNSMFVKTEDSSGIMIYKCNLCAYFSTTEQYVKRHVARHVAVDAETNRKLIKCLKCVFKSDCQTTMYNHWLENHADNKDNFGFKLHKCHYCTYKTKSVENLKEHETSVHFPTKDVKNENSISDDGNSLNMDSSSFSTDGNIFNIDGNSINDGNSFNIDGNSYSADNNAFSIDENSINTDGNIIIKDEMTIDDVLIKDEFMPNINIASIDSNDDNNSMSESFPNTVVSNDTNDSESSTAVEMVNEFGREEVIEEISPELVIKVEIVRDSGKDHEILHYKCIDCSYQSINRANLERHCIKHKNPKDIIWHNCVRCQFKTPYSKNIRRHMESAHKEKLSSPSDYKYKCDQCKKRFEFFYLLKKHKIIHTKPTVYRCKSCTFETTDRSELMNHGSTHKKDNNCKNVNNKLNAGQVENVLRVDLTENDDTSEENNAVEIKIEDVAVEEPKPIVQNEKTYKCHLCSYETSLITDLTNHSLSHKIDYQQQNRKQPNMIKCEHCDFKAKSKHIMLRHSIVHKTGDDIVWYYCDFCEFKTKHKNVRRTHTKRHIEKGDTRKKAEDMSLCEDENSSSDV